MTNGAGKGDTYRRVNKKRYDENFDKIFESRKMTGIEYLEDKILKADVARRVAILSRAEMETVMQLIRRTKLDAQTIWALRKQLGK